MGLRRRATVRLAYGLLGVTLAVLAWLAVLPWDLSTVDAAGHRIPGRSDAAMGPRIALALALVFVACVVLAWVRPHAEPVIVAGFGSATWALLFAWRVAVSRVSGANLWPIAFGMLVLPAAVTATMVVCGLTAWRRRRHRRP